MAKSKRPQTTSREETKVKKLLLERNISYDIQLNEEQKDAKRKILENTVTVLLGEAGSGKTLVACATALDQLFKGQIKKIYITRPTLTREQIGFLPGDINQKLDPFLIPIYDNLKKVYNRENKIEQLIEQKLIEIAPIAYMRGRTFDDCFLIVDECQNIDDHDMQMCLFRIGKAGKVVLCGDVNQVDFKNSNLSGLPFVSSLDGQITGLGVMTLTSNHRNPIVELLINAYKKRKFEQEKTKTLKYLVEKTA